MTKNALSVLTGFNFPKFNSTNGQEYFKILESMSLKYNEILYAMPILEDDKIIYKETRMQELEKIQEIFNKYDKYLLNIRSWSYRFFIFIWFKKK